MRRLASANVLPKQIRLPPLKGLQEYGFLFLPSGVRLRGLSVSKRRGKNSFGLCHSEEFIYRPLKLSTNESPFLKL